MTRFLPYVGAPLKQLLSARVPIPQSPAGWLTAILSALGLVGIGYLGGAAVMFYDLPSCDFLNKAFAGATAWYERGRSSHPLHAGLPSGAMPAQVTVDKVDKTCDGFTLYTATNGPRATLLDMRANVVHRWELPFRQAWTHPAHIEDPLLDEHIHWFHCHLYANGDLLAIYHADGDTPYGYGLVKLDKESKLLWAYANNVHHAVDVGEDGTIYTLTQKISHEPPAGLNLPPGPCLTDSLVVLSTEGQELENIPIAEAFAQSLYAPILSSLPKHEVLTNLTDDPASAPSRRRRTLAQGDLLHANSVKVLSRAFAPKFPLFQPGQVLLSLRNFDTIAVLDRSTRRVVWAAQGIWQLQHDAEFLDNGHLLLYDNGGSGWGKGGVRIVEYDPRTQAIPWFYVNEKGRRFQARFRGAKQRLPNGNTLIVDPDNRRLFEVMPDKELVWESVLSSYHSQSATSPPHAITDARRYSADELPFLKGVARARP